ncbi:MAG: 4-hydroxybenzoate octaprenyltransferase [Gammaproteobacteria bacterium]
MSAPLNPKRGIAQTVDAYLRLIRFDRPIGTLLLLWPTLWALWIAGSGHPNPHVFVVFVLGVVVMRSAGCAINDYADRHIDGSVARTSARPLAAGEIRPGEALMVFFLLLAVALALVVTLSGFVVKLAMIGAVLAATYPFFKRFTNLPQLYLGAAFGWGIPMAFAAQTGAIPSVAWVLFGANIVWATAYDTMYAMTDREDDLRIGVKSTAVLLGRFDRVAVALMQALALGLLMVAGKLAGMGFWYWIGLGLAAGTSLWQQFLIRERKPAACFAAFLNNSWFGAAVYCGVLLHYTFAT